jgi:hypothetical protein
LISTYGIGGNTSRECDVTWGYEYSLHKMGLALDWRIDTTDAAEWSTGLSFIRWLLATDGEGNEFAMARRIGVTQLIWHNRVWRTADPTWRIYCDPRDARDARCITNPTSRHDDHMHISFSLEAGYFHTKRNCLQHPKVSCLWGPKRNCLHCPKTNRRRQNPSTVTSAKAQSRFPEPHTRHLTGPE